MYNESAVAMATCEPIKKDTMVDISHKQRKIITEIAMCLSEIKSMLSPAHDPINSNAPEPTCIYEELMFNTEQLERIAAELHMMKEFIGC